MSQGRYQASVSPSPRKLARGAALAVAVVAIPLGLLESGREVSASTPEELSRALIANDSALRDGIDAWRAAEDPPSAPPPEDVFAQAEYLHKTVRFLAAHPNLAKRTISALPPALAREIRDLTAAARKLRKLSKGSRQRRLRTGEPPSLADLLSYYGKAKGRHRIAIHYLAAIHHVETKFGRVKSKSVAGARGPMQFIPSTWRIYGRGGNIQDPHDAILAAANLLRHNGAPRRYSRALFAYNPSRLYVAAVHRYAKLIARDPYALYFLYCWGP